MPLLSPQQINPKIVGSVAFRFRDDFPGASLDPNDWDVSVGTGQTVTVTGSNLTIASGTTANAVTTIYLKKYFRFPCRALVAHRFSATPTNISAEVELVSVDPDTGLPDDLNKAGFRYPTGMATQATLYTKNMGSSESTTSPTITNYTSGMSGCDIVADFDSVEMGELNASGTRTSARWATGDRIPEPGKLYTLRLRLRNAASAPANQNWTIAWVAVMDYEELQAELSGGRNTAASNSPSVSVNNMLSANNTIYEDSATALGAGATFTGTGRDTGGTSGVSTSVTTVRAVAHCFQAATPGTLYIDQSRDGTTWVNTASKALAGADSPNTPLECPSVFRYWRVRYVNGGTAQTAFWINSSALRA